MLNDCVFCFPLRGPTTMTAPIYLDHSATTPCDPRVDDAGIAWGGCGMVEVDRCGHGGRSSQRETKNAVVEHQRGAEIIQTTVKLGCRARSRPHLHGGGMAPWV